MAGLVTLDLDGTLVDSGGGFRYLHEQFGTRDDHERLGAAYRRNELDWTTYCDETGRCWRDRGITRDDVATAVDNVAVVDGADALLEYLESAGFRYGIVSSGIGNLADRFDCYEPSFVVSNEIIFDTDGVVSTIESLEGIRCKDDLLRDRCATYDVNLADVVHVGDSYTDAEAFDVAGTGLLVHPDPDDDLAAHADVVFEDGDLRAVVSYLRKHA